MTTTQQNPAAQVALVQNAAATKAKGKKTGGTRARPDCEAESLSCRLLSKAEVLAIVGVTYPTLWAWMRGAGKFPHARVCGSGSHSKSVWRSDEVEQWLAQLPVRRLKGDA